MAAVGRPATSGEEISGGVIGVPISPLNNAFMTYPEEGRMRTVPDAIDASFSSSGSPSVATGRSLGPLLPVDPEDDITRLKAGLHANGADAEAVDLCDEVFKDGISKEALLQRLTREQCKRLRLRDGKQFQMFLRKVEVTRGTRNCCRLCPGNKAMLYQNHRDALRHFLKDHFGMWFACTYW